MLYYFFQTPTVLHAGNGNGGFNLGMAVVPCSHLTPQLLPYSFFLQQVGMAVGGSLCDKKTLPCQVVYTVYIVMHTKGGNKSVA